MSLDRPPVTPERLARQRERRAASVQRYRERLRARLAREGRYTTLPEPSKPLPAVNRKRRKKRQTEAFGEGAERCRRLPCCACHAPAPSDPHHWRTRAAGGTDADTVPLCRACHDCIHTEGVETFQRRRNINLRAIAESIHGASPHNGEG